MPIKKILKIAGIILLVIFVLFVGLLIISDSLSRASNDNAGYGEPGVSTKGVFRSGAPSASQSSYSEEYALDSDMAAPKAAPGVTAEIDKKIIKTGNLSLKVEKAETAAESVTNIAKLNKGEVSDSSFSESGAGVKSGYITIRVPYDSFDKAFAEIKKVATQVVSETSNAQDITAEYIDLEARLKNTQAEEASFVAILSRSGKIEDVLAVTREVARVRGEIEQLQGQMRYLNSQTDMSTITTQISEDVEIAAVSQDWRPWEKVKLSVKQLLANGQGFIDGLIGFIIVVLPMLVIYGLIIWLVYWIVKKIYRRFRP
ncbi:MAG: DUF4349 domain-containing protein [Patescibacteria group bacterium]|nr:DUF4349 domain-containing protein [Patescibacteria group bacterium]